MFSGIAPFSPCGILRYSHYVKRDFMTTYKQTILANGLTIASEHMPHVESVCVGMYVAAGARDEQAQNNGVAHYLEHMAFKGTERRTAQDIAREIEDVGGEMNAYTSRETTAYHMKVLKEHLPLAVDMLGDIMLNSTFLSDEMERERGVIMQEYNAMLDTPDDLVFENYQSLSFDNQAMGRGILGSAENIQGMAETQLRDFIKEHYKGGNMVLAAAGFVDHDVLVALAEKAFEKLPAGERTVRAEPSYTTGNKVVSKDIEQVHIALGYKGISIKDEKYYAANVWNMVMGGGMASHLFQEVREKRGLAYSVYSFLQNFVDCGTFGVYAGTGRGMAEELLSVLRTELRNGVNMVSDEAMNRAKMQLIASVRMAQESSDARMSRIARNIFIDGRYVSLEEVIADVETVDMEKVKEAAAFITMPESEVLSVYGAVDANFNHESKINKG
jgi:predicted Zn-dependent peptidase